MIIPVVLVTAVTEHAVKPMIRKQAEHYTGQAETAVRPYAEDLEPNIPFARQAGCGAACLVKAGGINDRGCQPNAHKTKHFIPAIAGTSHPAGVGDHPGRLGEGRKRIRREATSSETKRLIRQPRADTAVRPYAEDLDPNTK